MDQSEKKSLIVLYPHANSGNAYLQQLRATLQSEVSLQVHDAQSEKDIAQQVQTAGRGLLIFCIRQKEDLTLVLNAMAALTPLIKSKALRVIGVNEIDHQQIATMLMKRGCADIFSSKLNAKALRHKINTALRIVATYSVPNSALPQAPAAAAESAPKKNSAPSFVSGQATLTKLAPLTLVSDCWLVRKERDLRRVQGRWIVDLIGPGPSTGIWEENPKTPETWIWTPKALADGSVTEKEFVKDEGFWVFIGRKPDFVWDLGRWRFLGDRMDLSFRKGTEVIACRFRVIKGALEYAENSPQAKQKLPMIIKSIENEVRFRKEEKAKAAKDSKFTKEQRQGIAFDKEFAEEEAAEGNIVNWEKDSDDSSELQIELEKRAEGRELNLRLGKPEEAGGTSGAMTFEEEIEANPYNQAPQPKLTVWVAPAQPRDGEKYRPLRANPIELSEQTLMLEIPTGQFKAGGSVILIMDDGLMKPESKSRAKGILEKVEAGEGTDTVTLQIDPSVIHMLDPIHKAFEIRQAEILNFLKAARGW